MRISRIAIACSRRFSASISPWKRDPVVAQVGLLGLEDRAGAVELVPCGLERGVPYGPPERRSLERTVSKRRTPSGGLNVRPRRLS
jgi:hypothetical protein